MEGGQQVGDLVLDLFALEHQASGLTGMRE